MYVGELPLLGIVITFNETTQARAERFGIEASSEKATQLEKKTAVKVRPAFRTACIIVLATFQYANLRSIIELGLLMRIVCSSLVKYVSR